MLHGTFTDPDRTHPHLKGKATLVRNRDDFKPDVLLAQFDDLTLNEGHGWHEFPAASFIIDQEVKSGDPWLDAPSQVVRAWRV